MMRTEEEVRKVLVVIASPKETLVLHSRIFLRKNPIS